jgi:hypothetical protein
MAQAITAIQRQQLTQEQQAMLMWPLLTYAAKLQHVLSYSDVESFTGIMAVGQHEALGKIYNFCEKRGWPHLNYMVINQADGMPGGGVPKPLTPMELFIEQNKVKIFDWASKDKPRPWDL